MNYPFLYLTIDQVNSQALKESLTRAATTHPVWDDWVLQEVTSPVLSTYVNEKFSHLELLQNKFFVSIGSTSNFHIDRFDFFHLNHRILIPLDENFHYEWILNEKVISFQPAVGQVLLFNNMVPHRFVSNTSQNHIREVIYFDLYDPLVKEHLKHFTGNYSVYNGELAEKFPNKAKP